MKRLCVSLILLLAIIGIGIWTLHTQQHIAENWLRYVHRMEQAYETDDIPLCRKLSEDFIDSIQENVPVLSSFLPHFSINDIQETASILSAILQQKDTSHFSLELARCRYLLQHLRESEMLSLENIL